MTAAPRRYAVDGIATGADVQVGSRSRPWQFGFRRIKAENRTGGLGILMARGGNGMRKRGER